jgi:hypothetical protein
VNSAARPSVHYVWSSKQRSVVELCMSARSPAISETEADMIFRRQHAYRIGTAYTSAKVCEAILSLALKGISEPYSIGHRYVSMHATRVRLIKGYDHEHLQSTSRQ